MANRGDELDLEEESVANKKVKFLCSHGGKILPRPADGHLKYVGGETRLVAVSRDVTFSELKKRLSEVFDGEMVIKYQLIPEELEMLVSVKNEEDLKHMLEEYERIPNSPKIRTFLFPDINSRQSISSINMLHKVQSSPSLYRPNSHCQRLGRPLSFGRNPLPPHAIDHHYTTTSTTAYNATNYRLQHHTGLGYNNNNNNNNDDHLIISPSPPALCIACNRTVDRPESLCLPRSPRKRLWD